MPTLCNTCPSAMMQGIRTIGHQQSKTSGQRLSSLFGSRALCNLDPSHLLGDTMCLNWGAKIPDYGVQDHIVHVCAPFFKGIESRPQYENRRCRWEEEHRHTQIALGTTIAPPAVLTGEPGSGMSENPRQQN